MQIFTTKEIRKNVLQDEGQFKFEQLPGASVKLAFEMGIGDFLIGGIIKRFFYSHIGNTFLDKK